MVEGAAGKDDISIWPSNTTGSVLVPYTHNPYKCTQQVLFIYLSILIHKYLTRKKLVGKNLGSYGERTGMGKVIQYI